MESGRRRSRFRRDEERSGFWRGSGLFQETGCLRLYVSDETERTTRFQDAFPGRPMAWLVERRKMAGICQACERHGREIVFATQPDRQRSKSCFRAKATLFSPKFPTPSVARLYEARLAVLYGCRSGRRSPTDVFLGHNRGRCRSVYGGRAKCRRLIRVSAFGSVCRSREIGR